MKKISIRTPIWKTCSVGLASRELTEDKIYVEITYTKKDGNRLYPGVYSMSASDIKTYPTQTVKGVVLHIVPIHELTMEKN